MPHASQSQAQALIKVVAEVKIALPLLETVCISLALCILLCTGASSKPSAGSQTYVHLVVCEYGLIIAHDKEDHL